MSSLNIFLRFCGSGISSNFLHFHLISILVLALTTFIYTPTVFSAAPTTIIITRADSVEVTVDCNSIAKNAIAGLGNRDTAIQGSVTGDGGVAFYTFLTPNVAVMLADIALFSGAKISNAMLIDFAQGVGAIVDCSVVTGNDNCQRWFFNKSALKGRF